MSAFTVLESVALLTLQCARRFYETQYIQIFSSRAKINITHYIVGYFHYFGAFLVIISQAPGFVRNTDDLAYIEVDTIFPRNLTALLMFVTAWYQQCRANVMLANLRKNRTGKNSAPLVLFSISLLQRRQFITVFVFFRCCSNWKAFDARGWLLWLCVRAAYVFRNCHVHSADHDAICKFVVVVGIPVGGQQSNWKCMAHTQMVFDHIQKLPEK